MLMAPSPAFPQSHVTSSGGRRCSVEERPPKRQDTKSSSAKCLFANDIGISDSVKIKKGISSTVLCGDPGAGSGRRKVDKAEASERHGVTRDLSKAQPTIQRMATMIEDDNCVCCNAAKSNPERTIGQHHASKLNYLTQMEYINMMNGDMSEITGEKMTRPRRAFSDSLDRLVHTRLQEIKEAALEEDDYEKLPVLVALKEAIDAGDADALAFAHETIAMLEGQQDKK